VGVVSWAYTHGGGRSGPACGSDRGGDVCGVALRPETRRRRAGDHLPPPCGSV